MTILFSERPGPRERHLRRKRDNPLFVDGGGVTQAAVDAARSQDREDEVAFVAEFRGLVQEAVDLPPQAESEAVLSLKERLDKAYERASGLGGDQQEVKAAIRKLQSVIMQAVWMGAGDDELARRQLEEEERARTAHFTLLEEPLVADILNPESPLREGELVPTLLGESRETLEIVLELFDEAQLGLLCRDALALLQGSPATGSRLAPRAWRTWVANPEPPTCFGTTACSGTKSKGSRPGTAVRVRPSGEAWRCGTDTPWSVRWTS